VRSRVDTKLFDRNEEICYWFLVKGKPALRLARQYNIDRFRIHRIVRETMQRLAPHEFDEAVGQRRKLQFREAFLKVFDAHQ
jgi:hypothetical protein